jgi:electron transfer flavoprotein beta subunit
MESTMNILVLIKQVPLPKEMKTTKEGFMARTGVRSIMNPYCKHAVEEALRFREQIGGKCTVLSMGPPSFEQSLREALSMGADDAYLLTDRRLAGSDTMATAQALTKAIKKIGPEFDIIFAGIQTIDGDTGHVGPQVAERIGYAQITYVDQLLHQGETIQARRITEHGFEIVEAIYPIVVTVTKYANVPRGPRLKYAIKARQYHIKRLKVSFDRPPCHLLDGLTPKEKVDGLIKFLQLTPHEEKA